MLSINGLHLENMVQFRGHEGEPLYQGDLYLETHKLGFWSQDSWGGPDTVILEPEYQLDRLNQKISALNPDKTLRSENPSHPFEIEYDLELLMGDYITLHYEYEEYLKALGNAYSGVLIASDGYHMTAWQLPKSYVKQSDEAIIKELESEINQVKASSFFPENAYTKHTVKIYRSDKEFEMGEAIQLKDIMKSKDIDKLIKDSSGKSHTINADTKTMLSDEKNR